MAREKKAAEIQAIARRLTQALEVSTPKLTRSRLAKKLGTTPGAVSHYLNGNRAVPKQTIERIARITNVEPGWLLHGSQRQHSAREPSVRTQKPHRLTWGFREAPNDGGKDFGNAGIYATPMAIRTIVREDGQNSLDAAQRSEVVLRFRLIELSPQSTRYDRVVRALRLDELADRIHAIENAEEFESKLGTKLSAGLEHVLNEKLVLLCIDDYGTHGLCGDEFDSTKPYCALVRDNLNSRKEAATAGGVFGLGAKVNIACSQISTVLFASRTSAEDGRTRLAGRTEMTFHELRRGGGHAAFAGPGWFGARSRSGLVESAWLPDDDAVLDDLMLRRDKLPRGVRNVDSCGTSILVVGFTDPQTEAGATTQQLVDAFVEAAAVNLWPAIMRGLLTVWVERYVDDTEDPIKREQVDPRTVAGVSELCDAWDKHFTGKTVPALLNSGDVASVGIPITVPATRPRAKGIKAHEELEAECELVVRLADADNSTGDPRVGHLAYVRGRAMVTRYQPRGNVVGGRPFHAMLLAGTMVGRSQEQIAAEQFLRIAEPPAHDKWAYNADLGERYARGAKKTLEEFHSRVTEELQRLLRPVISHSGDGPEVLRRLLQIRPTQEARPKQPQVRIHRSFSRVVDGAWVVDAELSISPTSRTLRVTPRLSFNCEGAPSIPVGWERIEVEGDDAHPVDSDLIVNPRTKRVSFRAWSNRDTHPVEASESSAILEILAQAEGGL
jgi:transcriptional regulator with XRE-family HTH domain